jgi:hypothetical protein
LNEANVCFDTEISDEEMDSDGVDEVPARPAKLKPPEDVATDDDEEDDEDGDEEEGIFQVEKVIDHKFQGKKQELLYQIVWKGYPSEDDYTWEPLENLLATRRYLSRIRARC